MNSSVNHIVVLGLGYVGLPLAVTLARTFRVTGLDIDAERIGELRRGHDRTNEVDEAQLKSSSLGFTDDPDECRGADIYIVTVPTPVDADNRPDLGALRAATATVAKLLVAEAQPIIVYESTVYPGVTEEVCGPLLEQGSGLKRGQDFFLGYSPERINPGDREHRIDRITKVIAGENGPVLGRLAEVYGKVTRGGVFRAKSIKAAEAAKVIENAQRDINIAFINEVTRIFAELDLSIWDVLAAAGTKWNFLNFQPGLVGGHCIGVDPYYLAHRAEALGLAPQVILAGRSINDEMGFWIADRIHAACGKPGKALVLGLAFKENVPDLRNSKVIDLIGRLKEHGHEIIVHDPLVDPEEAREEYGLELDPDALDRSYDLVVVAVPHNIYESFSEDQIVGLLNPGGLLADFKNLYGHRLPKELRRWTL